MNAVSWHPNKMLFDPSQRSWRKTVVIHSKVHFSLGRRQADREFLDGQLAQALRGSAEEALLGAAWLEHHLRTTCIRTVEQTG